MQLRGKRGRAPTADSQYTNEEAKVDASLLRGRQRTNRPIKNIVLSLSDSDFAGVEWYNSHVDPDVILWSSEPNVRTTPYLVCTHRLPDRGPHGAPQPPHPRAGYP